MSASAASTVPASATEEVQETVVQYIVLRRDLWAEQGWPLGPLIAQACHASIAALWVHKDDPDAQAYVAPEQLDHMHKVWLDPTLSNVARVCTFRAC
jgi:peptidyl-tRNA hydrolase